MIESSKRLVRLFRRQRVLDMGKLQAARPGRSQRSLFRDLAGLGYHSSCTHAGRYYTLEGIPLYDEHGLWFHQGVGFSRFGTLKATVAALAEGADAGHTHGELEHLVRVRVHNTLLIAVREGIIGRECIEKAYLYVSTDEGRAAEQVEKRQEIQARALDSGPLAPALVIEVLVEVIQASGQIVEPSVVVARLRTRGLVVSVQQVERVYREHRFDRGKKTAGSRRSRT